MTSRERVRAVLEHRIPDRVPNGLGGCETAGMHVIPYGELQKILGCEAQPPKLNTFMTNAVFEEPLIRAMEGDIILLDSPKMCASRFRGDTKDQWKPLTLWEKSFSVSVKEEFETREDGTVLWKTRRNAVCPKGGYYFDFLQTTDLTAELEIPDPDQFHPMDTIPDHTLRYLEEQAKRLYNETELSICLGESLRDLQISPGGTVNTMVLMMEEPDVMHALLEKCTRAALSQLRLLDEAVGKYVDILSIAHDFGDNRGVTIGDKLWREIYKPHYKELFRGWKSITDMKINLHSCGAVSSILDDLIECGVDIFNPVQTAAHGMSPASLKQRFGDRLVFWGGAYDAQLLPKASSYDEVYRAVYETVRTFGEGGNFIFAGVHNLPADMPVHHIKAMMDAFFDARLY